MQSVKDDCEVKTVVLSDSKVILSPRIVDFHHKVKMIDPSPPQIVISRSQPVVMRTQENLPPPPPPPHQVRVIRDGRLYEESGKNDRRPVIADTAVFRTPVVSSTSQPMRPPPPPPPLKAKTAPEEPSSSIPDLETDSDAD
ncbi:hypothetical protein DMENIID0001_148850 [Sergentomyia squamirostris]